MSILNLSLAGLLAVLACAICMGAARRPVDTWTYYHFDGHEFKTGQPAEDKEFIAVHENMRPVLATRSSKIKANALPSDQGAIAGIAYIQSSGGKLASQSGFVPASKMTVHISVGDRIVTTIDTDEQGYFTTGLGTGRYTISCGMARTDLAIKKGTTLLVPLRAGKRMVD